MNKILHKEFENTGEFVLPDYLGDVRKVVYSSAKAVPSGKFVSDGEIHLSGIVTYDVLYSDSENKLTRFEATSDYDLTFAIDPEGYIDSSADTRVTNFAIRPTGPRKLSSKASVACELKISESDDVDCKGSAFEDGKAPETRTEVIKSQKMMFGASGEREYAEAAERVVAAAAENIEIITSSGIVRITESFPVENGVKVKGEIIITAIVRTDEQPPFAIKRNIPFEETVLIENMPEDVQTFADGYLTSVNAFVTEDEEGYMVTVNAIAEFCATCAYNSDLSITCDAYLKDFETDDKYSDMEYTRLVSMGISNESFTLECPRRDVDAENIRDVLFISCDFRKIEKKIDKGNLQISGDAVFSGVACEINDDSTASYSSLKFTLPFSFNVNNSCQITEKTGVEYDIYPVFVECVLEAEKLVLKCEAKSNYRFYENDKIRRITECNVLSEIENARGCSVITVYYPEDGESLFDVAKKYHTTEAKIVEDNKLSEEVFAGSNKPLSHIGKLIIR